MFLKHASLDRVTALHLVIDLHRRGIRVAVDAEEVLRTLDLVYRAQFTEGFFSLPSGSISQSSVEKRSLSSAVKSAWMKNGPKMVQVGLKATCREKTTKDGETNWPAARLEELASKFRPTCYQAWWDTTNVYFVGGIQKLLRRMLKKFPEFNPSDVLTDVIFPVSARGGKPPAYTLGKGIRDKIVDCETFPRGNTDIFEMYLLCALVPSELAGLTNRQIKRRTSEKIVSFLKRQERLQGGLPVGSGRDEPVTEYFQQYAPVLDQDTGAVLAPPETISIDDVMDSKDWSIAIAELLGDPNSNKGFVNQLSKFVDKGMGLTTSKKKNDAQNVIKELFKALASGVPLRNARIVAVNESGVSRPTVEKIVKKFLLSLAKSLDKKVDIILTEEEAGDIKKGLGKFEPSATPETTALASALIDSVWMQNFQRKLEKGRGLEQYLPEGARKPMKVRTRAPKFQQPEQTWKSVKLSPSEKKRMEREMNRRAAIRLAFRKLAAPMPRATRRPAGVKFRAKINDWMRSDIQTKLENGGVDQSIIDNVIDRVAGGQYDTSGPLWSKDWSTKKYTYFGTQKEIVDWISGSYQISAPASWTSYPKYLANIVSKYGSAGDVVRDKAKSIFNKLKPHQRALAASYMGHPGSVRRHKKELSDKLSKQIKQASEDQLNSIVLVLEWASKIPMPPNY